MRMVAVDDNDLVNKLARRFHEAASKVAQETATKTAADEAAAKVVADEAAKASADKLQADRERDQKELDEKQNKKGFWGRLKFWKKGNKIEKTTSGSDADGGGVEIINGGQEVANHRNKRRNIGSFLAAALAGGAIATGAIAVNEYFDDDSSSNTRTNQTIIKGDNFNNNYGIIDKSSGSTNTNNVNSGMPETGIGNSGKDGSNASTGEINLSGDMNQDLGKLYLDNKSDNIIGDGIHLKARDAGEFFRSLGVNNKPERYVALFESFRDQDLTTEVVDLNSADADVVAFDFRAEDIELSKNDQTGLATFSRDRTIDLDLPEAIVSMGSTTVSSPTATATPESIKSSTFTATATKDATAVVSKTAVFDATATPLVDVITKTPQTSSEIKKSQRDAVKASLDFNERFTGSNLSFMAPMFLAAGPIIEFGSGLKFLNSADDEEDDEEKKETKSKKIIESK